MSGSHYSCYVELGTNKAYNGVGGLLLPQLSLEAVEYPTQSLQQTKRKTIAQTAMINLMKNKFINKKLDKYLIMCYYRRVQVMNRLMFGEKGFRMGLLGK